tara:strand:- start:35 stop:241 length:207 start_codon:yes stop_codon:yes gene_type:complete
MPSPGKGRARVGSEGKHKIHITLRNYPLLASPLKKGGRDCFVPKHWQEGRTVNIASPAKGSVRVEVNY